MLIFSTFLKINEKMTKDEFIKLVIEWNQNSPHSINVIPGIVWNGERTVRYGNDKLWLDIKEYRNQNIIAVRYEKVGDDGVVWDTDYVMNFNDMKMSILLDRSFSEEALMTSKEFPAPYFIYCLIKGGYVEDDGNLEVSAEPRYLEGDNYHIMDEVIEGKVKYRLPIVYVSKTTEGQEPIDVKTLAYRLKGAAHVLVEKDLSDEEAYLLGIEAGKILKEIHKLKIEEPTVSWWDKYLPKMERKIKALLESPMQIPLQDELIKYYRDNVYLMKDRMVCFCHGDYHLGNMIVHNGGRLIRDFDKFNKFDIKYREEDNQIYLEYHDIVKMYDAILDFMERSFRLEPK